MDRLMAIPATIGFLTLGAALLPMANAAWPHLAPRSPAPRVIAASSARAAACSPRWRIVPAPGTGTSDLVGVAAVSPRDVWTVGSSGLGSAARPLAMHWDGMRWQVVAGPTPPGPAPSVFDLNAPGSALNAVAATSEAVWAVGSQATRAGQRPFIARWASGRWRLTPAPGVTVSATLRAIAAVASDDIWAVGDARGTRALAERWDGRRWRDVAMPPTGGHGAHLYGVVALSAANAWAVGSTGSIADGSRRSLIEHWDGARWRVIPGPQPGAVDDALTSVGASSPSDVWAAGTAEGADYESAPLVERWDGQRWRVMPAPQIVSSEGGLGGVAVLAPRDVWAAAGPALTQWTGARWDTTTLRTSPYKAGDNYATASTADFAAVEAVAGSGLWAVGRVVENTDQQYIALIARADGGCA